MLKIRKVNNISKKVIIANIIESKISYNKW